MTGSGDVVEVVLDVVLGEDDAGKFARVFVQGVFGRGAPHPGPLAEGHRNAVQVFFGHDMRNISAFKIPFE